MKNKALFIDRDGVINVDNNYVYKIEDFHFMEGVFEALNFFQSKGYLLIVVTNQAGIGRGYFTELDFNILTSWMLKQLEYQGIFISYVYYCPYHPLYGLGEYKKNSFYRKPNPGMIFKAQIDFNLDLKRCILIGDKESDIEAGINAGVGINILKNSNDKTGSKHSKANHIVSDLNELLELRLDM